MSIDMNLFQPSTGQQYENLPSIITDGVDWSADFYGNADILSSTHPDPDGERFWMEESEYDWWCKYGQNRCELEFRLDAVLEEYADEDNRARIDKIIGPHSSIREYVFSDSVDLDQEYACASSNLDIIEDFDQSDSEEPNYDWTGDCASIDIETHELKLKQKA